MRLTLEVDTLEEYDTITNAFYNQEHIFMAISGYSFRFCINGIDEIRGCNDNPTSITLDVDQLP